MPLDLLKRSDKGSALNADEFDANLTAIENEVNSKASLDGDGKVFAAQLPETAPLGALAREIGDTAYHSLLGIACPPSLEFKAHDFIDAANGAPFIATFARASTATYVDAAGIVQTAAADELRHDFDPVTGEYKGWLIEETRTNLFLNSAALSTQNVTVTATAHTVTFWGAGTITFSGAYSGSLVGTGAGDRVVLTFTPSAGTLTCTVSGAVSSAQLEAGSFPTSYILTTSAAATRAADVLSVATSQFALGDAKGTLLIEFQRDEPVPASHYPYVFALGDSAGDCGGLFIANGDVAYFVNKESFAQTASFSVGALPQPDFEFFVWSWGDTEMAAAVNGGNVVLGTGCSLTGDTTLCIGHRFSAYWINGHIRHVAYFPRRLTDEQLQMLTG